MALQLHINVSFNRPADRTWRRPPGRPRNKWLDQLRNDSTVRLESSGGVLSTVDMVVQRLDGPRRLRELDDDDDDDDVADSNHYLTLNLVPNTNTVFNSPTITPNTNPSLHPNSNPNYSWRQKFCCRRTARVEQFTGYCKTDHQLRTVQATSENTFI